MARNFTFIPAVRIIFFCDKMSKSGVGKFHYLIQKILSFLADEFKNYRKGIRLAPITASATGCTSSQLYKRAEVLDINNRSVDTVTVYELDNRGSIHGRSWEFFSLIPCPDRLWGPPSLLSNGYWMLFPWG